MKRQFNRAVCVFMYTTQGNVLAVTRRHTQIMCFPGGKVDPGETSEQAARREVKEETGFEIPKSVELLPIYAEVVYGDDGMDYYCETFFIQTPISFTVDGSNAETHTWSIEEGIEVRFVKAEELVTEGDFVVYNTKVIEKVTEFLKKGQGL